MPASFTFDRFVLDTGDRRLKAEGEPVALNTRYFDALALLARWQVTPAKAIRAALHQIESIGGEVTGVALSLVNLRTQAEAGYGDPSYYYGYMKDYYVTA